MGPLAALLAQLTTCACFVSHSLRVLRFRFTLVAPGGAAGRLRLGATQEQRHLVQVEAGWIQGEAAGSYDVLHRYCSILPLLCFTDIARYCLRRSSVVSVLVP
jgi:hypothetical protein